MNGAGSIRTRRLTVKAATLLALIFCSIATAYYRAFSGQNLASYDDEGTLMTIIKRFLQGRALYDDLSTVYGPLYYLYEWCAHALTSTAVTHDSVRFVSIFFWVTSAILVFLLVLRATDSLILAAAAHFLSFNALGFRAIEPAHPQELCPAGVASASSGAGCVYDLKSDRSYDRIGRFGWGHGGHEDQPRSVCGYRVDPGALVRIETRMATDGFADYSRVRSAGVSSSPDVGASYGLVGSEILFRGGYCFGCHSDAQYRATNSRSTLRSATFWLPGQALRYRLRCSAGLRSRTAVRFMG